MKPQGMVLGMEVCVLVGRTHHRLGQADDRSGNYLKSLFIPPQNLKTQIEEGLVYLPNISYHLNMSAYFKTYQL